METFSDVGPAFYLRSATDGRVRQHDRPVAVSQRLGQIRRPLPTFPPPARCSSLGRRKIPLVLREFPVKAYGGGAKCTPQSTNEVGADIVQPQRKAGFGSGLQRHSRTGSRWLPKT